MSDYRSVGRMTAFMLLMMNVVAVNNLRNLPVYASYTQGLLPVYALAFLVFFLPSAWASAAFAKKWPYPGGLYAWIREAFGPRMGLMSIWGQWIYNVVWFPTAMMGLASMIFYLADPHWAEDPQKVFALSTMIFLLASAILWWGGQVHARLCMQSAIVGNILPVLAMIVLACLKPAHPHAWQSFWPPVWPSAHLGAYVTGIMFSMMGLEMSAVYAGSVPDPEKTVPNVLFHTLWISVLCMLGGALALLMLLPSQAPNLLTGLFDALMLLPYGRWLLMLMLLGQLGGVLAWLRGPMEGLFVAASEGALPAAFSRRNRFGAPSLLTGVQMIMVLLLSTVMFIFPKVSQGYWLLFAIAAELSLVLYMVLFLALLRLERREGRPSLALTTVSVVGFLGCLGAFIFGFVPPPEYQGHVLRYEIFLVGSVGVLLALPWFFVSRR